MIMTDKAIRTTINIIINGKIELELLCRDAELPELLSSVDTIAGSASELSDMVESGIEVSVTEESVIELSIDELSINELSVTEDSEVEVSGTIESDNELSIDVVLFKDT